MNSPQSWGRKLDYPVEKIWFYERVDNGWITWRLQRQLSKSFTVVIQPLSTGLIKPNFCFTLQTDAVPQFLEKLEIHLLSGKKTPESVWDRVKLSVDKMMIEVWGVIEKHTATLGLQHRVFFQMVTHLVIDPMQ